MGRRWQAGCWAGLMLAVLMTAGGAWAAAPGVARISLVQGQASLLRAGATEWGQALLNTPLVEGDEVYTGPEARVEIEFDYAHRAWLAGGSDVVIAAFSGQDLRLQLKSGTLSFASLPAGDLQTEIDFPNAGARPLGTGQWRVDVVDAAHTSVTADSGTVQVFTPQGSIEAQAGQQVQIAGSAGDAQYRTVDAPAEDAWDGWVAQREQRVEAAADYRDQQVSTSVAGAEDLDAYGRWVYVAGYGQCWTPYAAGFRPYYNGQWVWTPYYGWSWVSYEPWGWAPFHYGRWFWRTGMGWAWWPGGFAGPAIWAPAYVSFFVAGPGWGVGFAQPAIGWVALAPGERYVGYSQTRWITRATAVTQVYRPGANAAVIRPAGLLNAHAPGGVVAMPQNHFAGGPVNRLGHTVAVSRIGSAAAVHGTAPLAPAAGRTGLARASVVAPRVITGRTTFRRGPAVAVPTRPGLAEVGRSIQAGRAQAGMGEPAVARRAAPAATTPATTAPARGEAGGWRGFSTGGRATTAAERGVAGYQNHPMEPAGSATDGAAQRAPDRSAPEARAPRENSGPPSGDNGYRGAVQGQPSAPPDRSAPEARAPRSGGAERRVAPPRRSQPKASRPPARKSSGQGDRHRR